MWDQDLDRRPRERLLRHGPGALDDAELVALVLGHGRRGQSAMELATTLLGVHGSIAGLAAARSEALAAYAGMGPAKAAAVVAAFELGRRSVALAEAVPVRCAEDVVQVARREARGIRSERLLLLACDLANRVRWVVTVAESTVERPETLVGPVVEAVRAHDAAGFALARLTTSADPVVEPADTRLATRLRPAAEYAGVRFLDFVVVGDRTWASVLTALPVAEVVLPVVDAVLALTRPRDRGG